MSLEGEKDALGGLGAIPSGGTDRTGPGGSALTTPQSRQFRVQFWACYSITEASLEFPQLLQPLKNSTGVSNSRQQAGLFTSKPKAKGPILGSYLLRPCTAL